MDWENWRWVLWVRIHAAAPWDAFWKTNLAAMYATGEGVKKDERKAARLYRKAADKGHAEAQFNLGFMYLLGEGVQRDRSQARYWMEMAAAGGDEQAARLLADPQVEWE